MYILHVIMPAVSLTMIIPANEKKGFYGYEYEDESFGLSHEGLFPFSHRATLSLCLAVIMISLSNTR